MGSKVIVIDTVCLTPAHLEDRQNTPNLNLLANMGQMAVLRPVFPAVANSIHATITTGVYPEEHGVVSDGFFNRENHEIRYGNVRTNMVRSPRFWEQWRGEGVKTASLFMDENRYCPVDIILRYTPRYVNGSFLPWCYSKPANLYAELTQSLGSFPVKPFQSSSALLKACNWIVDATVQVLGQDAPELTFVNLPLLEYEFQRCGPQSMQAHRAVKNLDHLLGRLLYQISRDGLLEGTTVMIIADYVCVPVSNHVYINRFLREKGFLQVTKILGREYLNVEESDAFAIVDQQVAHIYGKPDSLASVQEALTSLPGVKQLISKSESEQLRLAPANSGDLIAVAEEDACFVHYWWKYNRPAPVFAYNIGMHKRLGADTFELLKDMEHCTNPFQADKIRGAHGTMLAGEKGDVVLIAAGPEASVVNRGTVYEHVNISELIRRILGKE